MVRGGTLKLAFLELTRGHRVSLACGFLLMPVNRISGLVLPASTKFLLDQVLVPRHYDSVVPLACAVFAASTVQGITSFLLARLFGRTAQTIIAETREKVQRHVCSLPLEFHDSNATGNLVSRILTDIESLRNLVGVGLLDFVGGILTGLIAFIALFTISAQMALIAAGMVVLFGAILHRGLKAMRPISRERGEINAQVAGRLAESLGGIRVVKSYRAEYRESAVFANGSRRLLDNAVKALTTSGLLTSSATFLVGSSTALIMCVGTRQIAQGSLTVGGFSAFTMFLIFLIAPMVQVVSIGTQLVEALAGFERTRELLSLKPEDEDIRRTIPLGRIAGHVEFRNVSFAYGDAPLVLKEIWLEAQPGTVTALVGPSGSGKSTLTALAAGFYRPLSGTILVDSKDISTVTLDSFRGQLGMVLQDTFLFDGSIRENVLFGKPSASESEFHNACQIARLNQFVELFEQGYETFVGERGVKLSGGQRQRVAIARAVLADPAILILDEATSNLDSESEAHIQEGLDYLMRGRTTFVIAHRLSTIRRADQILVIEHGRIVEKGTHRDLCLAQGRYFELYQRQRELHENLFLAPGEGTAESLGKSAPLNAKRPEEEDLLSIPSLN